MARSREIIQLYSGQAGVQIASACWELFCLEHGIQPDGTLCWDNDIDNDSNSFFSCCYSYSSRSIKCVPRVVLLDTEPIPIDEIRTGCYRSLFDPITLVTGKEDTGSNYGRGHNSLGSELIGTAMDSIRRVAECCDCLQGFISYRSIGGGTGSGFGTLIQERLADDFCKSSRHEFNIFPSPKISPVVVEPYNAVLSTHNGMELTSCSILLDNEALYDVCERRLEICNPTYTNLNRVVAQVVSSCTASLRFSGSANSDMRELETNLVPYPRIHFPLCTYSPLIPLNKGALADLSTMQITQSCFEPHTQLVKCDPRRGKYISCTMLYRGDTDLTQINQAIHDIKRNKTIHFVDWSPTGFKLSVNYQPPTCVPGGDLSSVNRAVCMLSTSSSIRSAWERIYGKYSRLFARSAFLHHYKCEGIEKADIEEAAENILELIADYEEVEKD